MVSIKTLLCLFFLGGKENPAPASQHTNNSGKNPFWQEDSSHSGSIKKRTVQAVECFQIEGSSAKTYPVRITQCQRCKQKIFLKIVEKYGDIDHNKNKLKVQCSRKMICSAKSTRYGYGVAVENMSAAAYEMRSYEKSSIDFRAPIGSCSMPKS